MTKTCMEMLNHRHANCPCSFDQFDLCPLQENNYTGLEARRAYICKILPAQFAPSPLYPEGQSPHM